MLFRPEAYNFCRQLCWGFYNANSVIIIYPGICGLAAVPKLRLGPTVCFFHLHPSLFFLLCRILNCNLQHDSFQVPFKCRHFLNSLVMIWRRKRSMMSSKCLQKLLRVRNYTLKSLNYFSMWCFLRTGSSSWSHSSTRRSDTSLFSSGNWTQSSW